ncbi:hypothetical protein Golob_020178, partial [Gossypium lobatum]|nr:hypothetical protein [Gossypium lobatum]
NTCRERINLLPKNGLKLKVDTALSDLAFHPLLSDSTVISPLVYVETNGVIKTIQASRINVVAFHTSSAKGSRQADPLFFHPPRFTGQASQFEEKRRVPTGSNPLHNRR